MRHEVQSLKQLHRPLDHAPPAAVRGVVSFAGMMGRAARLLAAEDGRCGVFFGAVRCTVLDK